MRLALARAMLQKADILLLGEFDKFHLLLIFLPRFAESFF
jgi:hypothetical protein